MERMKIPKTIHQVWVGPLPPPVKWMNTWKEFNPDWTYELWDNERVFSRNWENQKMIDFYVRKFFKNENEFKLKRGYTIKGDHAVAFHWHLIADILRYEILFKEGGYMPGADSECLKPITPKFDPIFKEYDLYTVNTGWMFSSNLNNLRNKEVLDDWDKVLWERFQPNNASPILAASRGNKFLEHCIEELSKLEEEDYGEAVDTTGNVFIGKMLKKYPPKNAHIPNYILKKDRVNDYSKHHAGTTTNSYGRGR